MTTSSTTRAPRGRRAARPSGDDREAAILETAGQLLETKKFADISVDDLAKGAGISRPTFYFYFPSKEAVLLSLIDPLIKRADTGFDSALDTMPTDPREAIRRGIEIFFSSFGSHPATARAGTEALNSCPEFRTFWSGLMQKWIGLTAAVIIAERQRGAAPDTIPAMDLATSLNLMNERTMMSALSAEQPAVDYDHVVDTLTHIWLTSIYGDTP
ncbi:MULTISPECIES: TetR/AcrR family transcriptional regulator [unclassified Mycolicibacterium]|uniref:TetR/AcrR family transcriptional regulator n=1 Tax=unclassified Mycolicibacterium TaxID=2636767 RepID=UPI00130C9F33|nr:MULTISPECIES: TetR/AcrR family transcriptional regulator [unclassified Mycolicibacterium]MUL83187.1 TetR/AcrR family transcriptional regulator [Mycolicibacterium sp. CBMA 329]MUL89522.1 TetR/AcrR family transcriptional regulator [Mycolicibacterium sp. CBMA 331]MUM02721.1 TetR/AcrR family transcriptional regulator [Mycolicibacterium sp. CBMA 334]MUM27368.1 TetR/AcrR family transcriptional regulator [Mycolicibacterium sp. CBMA 295]MUM39038.1 TetR/AcrR family transcriptional regulator [Mycolic